MSNFRVHGAGIKSPRRWDFLFLSGRCAAQFQHHAAFGADRRRLLDFRMPGTHKVSRGFCEVFLKKLSWVLLEFSQTVWTTKPEFVSLKQGLMRRFNRNAHAANRILILTGISRFHLSPGKFFIKIKVSIPPGIARAQTGNCPGGRSSRLIRAKNKRHFLGKPYFLN